GMANLWIDRDPRAALERDAFGAGVASECQVDRVCFARGFELAELDHCGLLGGVPDPARYRLARSELLLRIAELIGVPDHAAVVVAHEVLQLCRGHRAVLERGLAAGVG